MAYYPNTMSDAPAPPTLAGLFFGFFTVGMCGFGGTLPWARRMVVDQRRWMTPAEFTDMLGLCQFLPAATSSISPWPSAHGSMAWRVRQRHSSG